MIDPPDFEGRWDYGTLPANIRVGAGAYLEAKSSFARFRSTREPGLVLGDRVRVHHWTAFNVEPGGLVEVGSVIRGEGETVSFVVTDGNAGVPVTYTGILPDLFIEGQGMVGRGRYVNGTFEADEILARHDETYMPVEVVDALKEQGVYQEPDS